jgi:hypothetical protein
VALVPVLTVVSVFISFSGAEHPSTDLAAYVGFALLGLSSLVFTLLVLRDLAWLGARQLARIGDRAPVDAERRKLLLSSLNMGGVGGAGMMFGYGALGAVEPPSW